MNVLFAANILTICVSFSQCATPIFKHNAGDYMDASFKKSIRRGVEKEDFTKIEIEARPMLMIHDASSMDKNRVTLEIKSGDGAWTEITQGTQHERRCL